MSASSGTPWDAVFFDMDGTLIDSEPLSDRLVSRLLDERGLPAPPFSLSRFHGQTWETVEATLVELHPSLSGLGLAERFEREFHELLGRELPQALAGACEAFIAAARHGITGIVSSSPRATIELVAAALSLAPHCRVIVGAEDVRHSKPHPECYLLAAERAGVAPRRCLVFEDSEAGLAAAREAGMTAIAVRGNRSESVDAALSRHARSVIGTYADLPPEFFVRGA